MAARNKLIHDPTPGKGARLIIRSILNEGSGQYTFKNDFADLTVGAAYRQFLLGSEAACLRTARTATASKTTSMVLTRRPAKPCSMST